MIQWVKDELRAWGYQIGRTPNGWPPLTMLGRIMLLGPDGARTGSKRDFVPKGVGMGKSLKTHRIIQQMPFDLREIVYIKYVCQGVRDTERMKELDISRKTFYGRLDRAHYYFAGRSEKSSKLNCNYFNNL